MQLLQFALGGSRQDGAAHQPLPVPRVGAPHLPETRKYEWSAALITHEVGLLLAILLLPLEEAGGRNEHTAAPEGVAEGRLVRHLLAAGVEGRRLPVGGIAYPGGHQPPTGATQGPLTASVAVDHRHQFGGGDVVARFQVQSLRRVEVKDVLDILGAVRKCVAATHGSSIDAQCALTHATASVCNQSFVATVLY